MWSSDKLIILEFGYLLASQVLRSLGKKEKQPPVERDLVQWVNFLCEQSKFSKSENGKFRGVKEVGDFLQLGHCFTTHHPPMSSFSQHRFCDYSKHSFANAHNFLVPPSLCNTPGKPLTPPHLLCTEWVSTELKCAVTVPCDISFEWAMSPSEKGLSSSSLNFKLPFRSHSLQPSTSLEISVKKNWSNPARPLYCLLLNPRSVFLPFARKSLTTVRGSLLYLVHSGPFLLAFPGLFLLKVAPVGKNLPASAGDMKTCGFHPWVWKIPGGGHGNPPQFSCLEHLTGRGA